MRLLEVGMGCSVHGGVNGLNTLAVCSPLLQALHAWLYVRLIRCYPL